jgi:hypothetical protein
MVFRLTDSQLEIVNTYAAPLPTFLEAVARKLANVELGDGVICRAAKDAQADVIRGARRGD